MFNVGAFLDSLDNAAKDTLEEDVDKGPSATWIRSQRKGASASNAGDEERLGGFPVPMSAPNTSASQSQHSLLHSKGLRSSQSSQPSIEDNEMHALTAIASNEVSATPFAKSGTSPQTLTYSSAKLGENNDHSAESSRAVQETTTTVTWEKKLEPETVPAEHADSSTAGRQSAYPSDPPSENKQTVTRSTAQVSGAEATLSTNEEIERLNTECLELEDIVAGLKAEVASAWAAYRRVQETSTAKEEENKADQREAETALKASQREVQELMQKLQESEDAAGATKATIKALEDDNEMHKRQIAQLQSSSSGNEQSLRVDLASAIESSERLRLEHATLTAQAQKRQASLEMANAELSTALTEARRAQQVSESNNGYNANIGGQSTESLKDDLEVHRQHQARLQEQVNEQDMKLQSLQTQLLNAQTEAHRAKSQLEDETHKAATVAAEHVRKLAAAEERVLQAQATAVQGSSSSDNDAVRNLHTQVANLSQQLLRKQQHVLDLQAERSALRSRLEDAQATAQALERQVSELRDADGVDDDIEGGYGAYGRAVTTGMTRRGGANVSPGTASKSKGPRVVQEMEKLGVRAGPKVARAVDAIDTWSLSVGRVLRAHPLIRVGAILYLLILHVWVFFIISIHTHTLDDGDGMLALDPRDFVNNSIGDAHVRSGINASPTRSHLGT